MNEWQNVTLPVGGVLASCPDPYIAWAERTGWAYLGNPSERLPVLVELADKKNMIAFADALKSVLKLKSPIALPYLNDDQRHATLRLSRDQLHVLASNTELTKMLARFELSAPIRLAGDAVEGLDKIVPLGKSAQAVMGVIDVGFPFAHPMLRYRNARGKWQSRIARWWAMDEAGPFAGPRTDIDLNPATMGYGQEVWRGRASKTQSGLEGWLNAPECRHADEATLYELANYFRARRRATHGSHVLDLLLGPMPLRSRLPLMADRLRLDPDAPPTWAPAQDTTSDPSKSDLVLVELPAAAINDSSGGWLSAHVFDAVSWIAEISKNAAHVVVTLSYGSTVGPHDGSSILDAALKAALDRDKKLQIVVAAGNSFASRLRARLDSVHKELAWRVPPDSRTPAFMQLWRRSGSTGSLTITPPGGLPPLKLNSGEIHELVTPQGVAAVVSYLPTHSRGKDPMVLLALAPTAADGAATVPAGDWVVSADGAAVWDAYVARNDRDLHARMLGRASWIADDADEPTRYLRTYRDDAGKRNDDFNEPSRSGAVLRRRGTLNGIASLDHDRLHVAAGYQLRTSDHTGYSSAGDRADGGVCRGPSAAMVTDESRALRGVRAAGVYGASQVRLVGTSAAAPQLARQLLEPRPSPPAARGPAPPPPASPTPPPTPGKPGEPEDLFGPGGDGNKLPVAARPAEL